MVQVFVILLGMGQTAVVVLLDFYHRGCCVELWVDKVSIRLLLEHGVILVLTLWHELLLQLLL